MHIDLIIPPANDDHLGPFDISPSGVDRTFNTSCLSHSAPLENYTTPHYTTTRSAFGKTRRHPILGRCRLWAARRLFFLIISFSARARFRGCFLAVFARCHHRLASRPRMEDEFPFLVDNISFHFYHPRPHPLNSAALYSLIFYPFWIWHMISCSLFYDYIIYRPHVDLLPITI